MPEAGLHEVVGDPFAGLHELREPLIVIPPAIGEEQRLVVAHFLTMRSVHPSGVVLGEDRDDHLLVEAVPIMILLPIPAADVEVFRIRGGEPVFHAGGGQADHAGLIALLNENLGVLAVLGLELVDALALGVAEAGIAERVVVLLELLVDEEVLDRRVTDDRLAYLVVSHVGKVLADHVARCTELTALTPEKGDGLARGGLASALGRLDQRPSLVDDDQSLLAIATHDAVVDE